MAFSCLRQFSSQYFSEGTGSSSNLVHIPLVPCMSTSLFCCFFSDTLHFYSYVSSAFLFKNRPTPFPFPINWLFFDTKPEVPQSVFVRLFPCGDVWPVPESGPCIPWKMEARSGGWTKFRINLFGRTVSQKAPYTWRVTRRCALGCQLVPSLECWVWP